SRRSSTLRPGSDLPAGLLSVPFLLDARLDLHSRSRAARLSSSLPPLATLSGRSFRISLLPDGSAFSSFSLMSSQFSFPSSEELLPIRTQVQPPCNFSPSRRNFNLPARRPATGSPSSIQRPRSHSSTVPPPYSPRGMVPSKSPYSTG